jgi:polyketide synthase PksM
VNRAGKDIAVIGMGCRFPDADSGAALFRNLLHNRDSVREIPLARWNAQALYQPPTHAAHEGPSISSKWGGFIDGVELFDSRFFKILPTEAELLDPQQKLFLTCSWEALEDAGYARRSATAGKPIGVYAGVTWSEFSLYANEYGYLHNRYRGAGSLYWGIPNRVSYFFDFTGPSLAIDTACSSSLVALHLAVQSLQSGETSMALAGGVNLNLHPAKYLFLSGSNFLSTEGKCRGFGEGGSGYVPSEGVAVLVLKPLAAAVAEGDRIYGVIRGTATNHGGKATGYTVPNPRAHSEVIAAALQRARVTARDISYVECHGTGTDLGDPIEIAGLRMAFEAATRDRNFCGIGTVKSNIGHCEAAAGVAGLIKVLHGMRAGTLPATLHAQEPNRKIDFANSPFYLVQQNRSWRTDGSALFAGVSSFGAGGSNGHCIVQSYAAQPAAVKTARVPRKSAHAPMPQFVPISALNPERTHAYCAELLKYLRVHESAADEPALIDLVHTLQQRESFEHRVAFVAPSLGALKLLLAQYLDDDTPRSVLDAPDADPAQTTAAALWVEGGLKLQDLPRNPASRLLSLPTYAFERVRSWLHTEPTLYARSATDAVLRPLHPLLDENLSVAALGAFAKTLRRDEYFLDEHWVEGDPVLPGVCLMEMVGAAARIYLQQPQVGALALSDVWFLEPVALRADDGAALAALRVEVQFTQSTDHLRFDVLSRGGTLRHTSGKLRTVAAAAPLPLDLAQIAAGCTHAVAPVAFYARFGRSGIVQKGCFQVVTDFRCDTHQAIVQLRLDERFAGDLQYAMNPTLLDGAVQAAMFHVFVQQPETATILPFQVGALIQYRPLEADLTVVASRIHLPSKKYEISLCNRRGDVLAQFQDFVLREHRDKRQALRPLLFAVEQILRQQIAQASTAAARPQAPESTAALQTTACLLLAAPLQAEVLPPHNSSVAWTSLALPSAVADASVFSALTHWIQSQSGLAQVAIVFDADATLASPEAQHADAFAVLSRHARTLFDAAQSIAAANRPADVIVAVCGTGPLRGALAQAGAAMLKCLNAELPKQRWRLLELCAPVARAAVRETLAAEFIGAASAARITYQDGQRLLEVLRELPLQQPAAVLPAAPEAWIVTGGGGRLGMMAAQLLLAAGKHVVLLGRSLLDEAKTLALEAAAAAGRSIAAAPDAGWRYLQCDLTDRRAVAAAVDSAVWRHRSSWGIVHCAGQIQDGAFVQKKWRSVEQVLRAKAESLLLLAECLAEQDVRRLCLFSSLTSLFGNRGQTDYAFANGVLDGFAALAHHVFRSRPGVTVMHWPYWEEGGMRIATDKLGAYADTFLTQALPTAVGLELLTWMLHGEVPQGDRSVAVERAGVVYSDAGLAQLQERLLLKPAPESLPVAPRHDRQPGNQQPSDGEGVAGPQEFGQQEVGQRDKAAEGAPPAGTRMQVQRYLLQFFERQLKLSLTDEDLHLPFAELGVDSIAQMDLINKLERENRFSEIPQSLLVENTTLASLTEFFLEHHRHADYSVRDYSLG